MWISFLNLIVLLTFNIAKTVNSIADLSSYYFSSEEEYERVRNLNSDELKLWLIKKVLEDDIEVVLFFQEECDD